MLGVNWTKWVFDCFQLTKLVNVCKVWVYGGLRESFNYVMFMLPKEKHVPTMKMIRKTISKVWNYSSGFPKCPETGWFTSSFWFCYVTKIVLNLEDEMEKEDRLCGKSAVRSFEIELIALNVYSLLLPPS